MKRQRISFKLILETLAVIGSALGITALKQRLDRAKQPAAAERAAPKPPASTAAAAKPPEDQPGPLRPGWSRPLPHELPPPTYWPMIVAIGIVFLAWGAVTSWFILGAGLLMFLIGIGGWIGELRNDTTHGERKSGE